MFFLVTAPTPLVTHHQSSITTTMEEIFKLFAKNEKQLKGLAKGQKQLAASLAEFNDRLHSLEVASSTPTKRRLTITPLKKLENIRKKSKEFFAQRQIILDFNKMQRRRKKKNDPDDPVLTWTNKNGMKFSSVRDSVSLLALATSDLGLIDKGNPFRKFPLIIKDGRLVPLSSDFKGGIGISYIWTPDSDMPPPSKCWKYDYKNQRSKQDTDPRIGVQDPMTGKVWDVNCLNDDEDEDDEDESESEESDSDAPNPKKQKVEVQSSDEEGGSGDNASGDHASGDNDSDKDEFSDSFAKVVDSSSKPKMGVDSPEMGVDSSSKPKMGVDSPKMGVDSPKMGVNSPSLVVNSPKMGVDSSSKGVNSPMMGVDSSPKGVNSPKVGVDSPKMDMDIMKAIDDVQSAPLDESTAMDDAVDYELSDEEPDEEPVVKDKTDPCEFSD